MCIRDRYMSEPFDLAAGDRRSGEIRREIRAMGPVNVTAVEEYRAGRERYDDLSRQRDDLIKAQEDLPVSYTHLDVYKRQIWRS